MSPRPKANGKQPKRGWRVIAIELACETDPVKARTLLDELNRDIVLVRYDDLIEGPAAPSVTKPM